MIRVLIVDDHPVVREGLAAMLATQRDFEVVGEAGDGAAGRCRKSNELAAGRDPDGPRDAARRRTGGDLPASAARHPDARVLVLTAYDTDERILDAVQAGAQGYLLKGAPREELFRAMRVVNQGGSLLEPVVAHKLLGRMGQHAQPSRRPRA